MIADLLSHHNDLNKRVDSDKPRVLLPDSLFAQKIFLKDDLEEQQQTLQQIHNSPAGGHPGIANTWKLVREHYEGPRLLRPMDYLSCLVLIFPHHVYHRTILTGL